MAALSRPSLRSASRSTELSATGIQRNSSTHITKTGKRTRDLALFNDDNYAVKKQKTRVQDLSNRIVAQGHDADSPVASTDKSSKGLVTPGSTLRSTQLENAQQYIKNAGIDIADAKSTPNGTVNDSDTVAVARKVDKRSLRSQDGGSRSKSELALYFPNYDELVSIEPKETGIMRNQGYLSGIHLLTILEFLTIDTLVHITDEPLKPAASMRDLLTPLIHASNNQNPDIDHSPAKVNGIPRTSEEPEEDLMKLNDAQRIDFSSIDCPPKAPQEDPLTDAVYLKAHRRAERQEKQLRNIEKERAQHEKVQLERLLDGLKGHDWLRVMGISGITDSEKRFYEPKREYLVQEVESLLDKFRVWKEEEKRRKLEKEQKTEEEDEEEMSEASDGEPPDYNDVDAWAARQLHREASSANGKQTGKSRSHRAHATDALPLPVEKPFTSFFSKPYLRAAALGKHRRGRTRFAFGQPLPDIVEMEFEVPSDLLTQDALSVSARNRRRANRELREHRERPN